LAKKRRRFFEARSPISPLGIRGVIGGHGVATVFERAERFQEDLLGTGELLNQADLDRYWTLFLRQRRRLTQYVRRLVPDPQDAIDVVQEVGLRLLRQPSAPASRDQFEAWCRSVARNVVLQDLRAARYERQKLAALGRDGAVDVWLPERLAAMRSVVIHRLEGVDAESRDLLFRRYVLEQTSGEIAHDLKLTAAAVRMRLMRLRESLGFVDPSES
jgi:RNA polymerase sigma-70 factor (ECF subfamily)